MLKTVRWDVISTQGSEEEDQKGAGGVRNQPGPEKEQPTLPTIGHCQPELKCLSFSWLSLYFHSKGDTQTIYRSVFARSSTFLYGLIGNIFSAVVFSPHNQYLWTLPTLRHVALGHSLFTAIWNSFGWTCHTWVPAEGHIGYFPFSAIINNMGMSILTWASSGETSRQWFSSYVRVTQKP